MNTKSQKNKNLKICRVTSIAYAFVHFKDVVKTIAGEGHQFTFVSSEDSYWEVIDKELNISKEIINIERDINPLKDLVSVFELYRFLNKAKPNVVHSSTPKAGIVTAIAAYFARVPVRIHTFTGQRWETLTGFKRKLLISLDKLISRLNTWCYTDSPSQTKYLQDLGILDPQKSSCLGSGSFGGIDPEKYSKRDSIVSREKLGIKQSDYVISFVGRITRDKGIVELVEAFIELQKTFSDSHLLLIGSFEEHLDPLPDEIVKKIKNGKNIHFVGFQNHPEDYLRLSDVMCLPSYREGFGTVVLESALLGIPTIGTDIIGLRDAIVHQETGLLVKVRDVSSLVDALTRLAEDSVLRKSLGEQAKNRVIRDFNYQRLADLLLNDYERFVNQAKT